MTLFELVRPVRKYGLPVEVRSRAELAVAISSGVRPSRIIMHADGAGAGPLRCAINAGVGQYVVDSCQQVAVLAHWGRTPLRVLVDVTTPAAEVVIDTAMKSDGVELIGLHCRITTLDDYAYVIAAMIETMAAIHRERGLITTRLSVGRAIGVDPRDVARVIEDALDESCARFRFPRPAVALSSSGSGLGSR